MLGRATSVSQSLVDIPVRSQGSVSSDDADYARTRVAAVLRYAHDHVLRGRIRLTRLADPALARPAVAQVNLDVNGRLVRAQVSRPTMREAIDEVHDRLRDRLQRAAGDWEAIRGGWPSDQPHEWRHTSVPTERPPYFPRPAAEREIVRHKAFSLARMTVDECAYDMAMLDYGFHLFTEEGSGVDSLLYRTGDGVGHRLAQVDPHSDTVEHGATPVTVSAQPAPELSVDEAVDRLNLSGWPFVFFRDPVSRRGCVLYHRYDGHYGLITPAG
jgi:ribosome-associated translation inhibitor RaiA